MTRLGICLVMAGSAALFVGCGMPFGSFSSAKSQGGIAVVDLDKVASETGVNLQIRESFQVQENSVKQQLAQVQMKANSQLEAKLQEMGETPTDEQKQELVKFRIGATNLLSQLQNQAKTKLGQYHQNQIVKFRTEIKPIALEVAKKHGLSVVLPKNEGLLLAVDSGVDITDEVIRAYRESRPAPAIAAPAPAAKPAVSSTKAPAEAVPARTASKAKESKESTK